MTREDLKKYWHIIEAFKNGAELQFFNNYGQQWLNLDEFEINSLLKYRIKPSPKYIPFDFSDAEKLIGKVITTKMRRNYYLITRVDVAGVVFGGRYYDYVVIFDDYQFLDGSPCGKLKE